MVRVGVGVGVRACLVACQHGHGWGWAWSTWSVLGLGLEQPAWVRVWARAARSEAVAALWCWPKAAHSPPAC
eukprot:scaffold14410_cov60-Phaeocystis_antarctica.AAC.10